MEMHFLLFKVTFGRVRVFRMAGLMDMSSWLGKAGKNLQSQKKTQLVCPQYYKGHQEASEV
jgi:hypothetical protein